MQIKAGLEPEPDLLVDINTTPLVDVLLVLLVMLIITIPIQLHAVNLEMPGTNAPTPPTEPRVVRLEVTASGHYLWNGDALPDRAGLDQKLHEAASQAEQPELHVRPDRAAKYDVVAAALSSAQRAGLVKIGLVGSEQFSPRTPPPPAPR